MLRGTLRAVGAAALLSLWLVLLLAGLTFGGWVHLLLAAALICFPWRRAGASRNVSELELEGGEHGP